MNRMKELAAWLKSTADDMYARDEAECASFFPDPHDRRYAVCVGWLPGYGKSSDPDIMRSPSEPEYALNAEICEYNPADCCDLEWMRMPVLTDGMVWDTGVTLGARVEWTRLAGYLLEEHAAIVKASANGELEAE